MRVISSNWILQFLENVAKAGVSGIFWDNFLIKTHLLLLESKINYTHNNHHEVTCHPIQWVWLTDLFLIAFGQ